MIQKVPSYKTPPQTLPFSTYEWVKIWHETIGKEWESYILSVNDEVIAPFARKNNEIIFAGGDDVADYLDIIGADEAKTKAWPEIIDFLKKDGVTSLHLNNIPQNSPTLSFFSPQKEDTTPIMSLPPILGKKARHEMERKIRKFEREHEEIIIHDSDNPVSDTDLFLSLMKLDERKKRFLTLDMESFFHKIIEVFQKNIVLTILTINNSSAAALLAFRIGDTIMSYNSGFNDQRFSGAGFYLKAMHIKRATESGIKTYNFLQGSERYKYELGGKDFFVYRVDTTL
ncbi:MAG: GNAT family N-acetyltransferase [Candidatus Gottesmanbacteria bacterium]|nr:GNAT family N-acetyltransferase [Candidatus Gottesmanbacteria bacterium]